MSVLRSMPGVQAALTYRRGWLLPDVVAGIVLSTLLVPQGMAYAELAGLPPITGLYTSIMCLLGYAVFGPPRILVLGPDSSLGPMIAATILPLAAGGRRPRAQPSRWPRCWRYRGRLLLIGAGRGQARLRRRPVLQAHPDRLPERPGAHHPGRASCPSCSASPSTPTASSVDCRGSSGALADGKTVPAAVALGVGRAGDDPGAARSPRRSRACWWRWWLAIAATVAFGLAGKESAWSAPSRRVPAVHAARRSFGDIGRAGPRALGITLVSLTDTISTSSAFAARTGQEVDGNQEMIGIGAANLAAGLFQGFPVSTSGSRTAVAETAGAKSQLTGVVGAVAIT